MVSAPPPLDWRSLGDDEVVARMAGVTVWKSGGQRAPHKPLLLLSVLARLRRRKGRLVRFADIEEPLRDLLRSFGPDRRSFHPEYPFWHLQSDGLWVIPQRDEIEADLRGRSRQSNPPRSVLLREHAEGGLPEALFDRLRRDPALVNRVVARILDDNFPPSLHQDVLDAVGMPWVSAPAARDRAFRDAILRIYEHRCAVCGYDGMLGHAVLGLEAAHVRWHAAGGPDTEDNGLALCTFHHKAFDQGALSLAADLRIVVSQHVRGGEAVTDWLLRFVGSPIRGPQPGTPPPAEQHVRWHRHEVFRGPARGGSLDLP